MRGVVGIAHLPHKHTVVCVDSGDEGGALVDGKEGENHDVVERRIRHLADVALTNVLVLPGNLAMVVHGHYLMLARLRLTHRECKEHQPAAGVRRAVCAPVGHIAVCRRVQRQQCSDAQGRGHPPQDTIEGVAVDFVRRHHSEKIFVSGHALVHEGCARRLCLLQVLRPQDHWKRRRGLGHRNARYRRGVLHRLPVRRRVCDVHVVRVQIDVHRRRGHLENVGNRKGPESLQRLGRHVVEPERLFGCSGKEKSLAVGRCGGTRKHSHVLQACVNLLLREVKLRRDEQLLARDSVDGCQLPLRQLLILGLHDQDALFLTVVNALPQRRRAHRGEPAYNPSVGAREARRAEQQQANEPRAPIHPRQRT
eukprot:Rhum_TRINITY_DN14643_c6_g3::Rhum_TRINITY_DN14643_c6_g3_i1::g.107408::m.107408